MRKKLLAAALLLTAAGTALAMRARSGQAAQLEGDRQLTSYMPDIDEFQLPDFGTTNDESNMNSSQSQANIAAMLRTIIQSEGTDRGGRNAYATCYAYAFTVTNFADHPGNLGWKGVKLPDAMCAAAGFKSGCVSTAAGAYQITKTTWNRLKAKLNLPDFSPASQDAAALELIRERGALVDVAAGRFGTAIAKCKKEWASLPGAGYGQPEKSLASLQSFYLNAGGALA